ncbi:MAG: site-specific DNA-methyltransferase [Clostridium sp.]|nr:site-specific DNA-methyltransferase [Clostridium sp.]
MDPPYNTGNDFVYEDDFAQNMEDYKEVSGDFDEEGNRLFKNTDSNGRFHTDWLNMMYPRLKLARDLLSDDGIIFISIDDHEVSNLKKMCDEVFGESKFVEIFCWQKTSTPPNLSYKTKKSVEYILAYEKQNCGKLEGLIKYSKSTNGLMNQSNNVGILQFPHEYTETSMHDQKFKSVKYGTKSYDIELMNDIEIKDGKFTTDVILKGKFKWNQNYLNEQVKNGTKLYIKTKAFSPSYDKEEYDPEKPWNIIDKSFGVGTNVNASDELDNLFTINFSENLYPKPSSLISYLISMLDMKDSIILDFFSGSATTAHAAMELNAKDNGNRKYIMVQLPEKTDNDKFETICEIGKARIRRAGKKIKEDYPESKLDDGFRVLRVDSSNMKDVYHKPEAYSQSLLDKLESNIKGDRNEEDLLFQVMLSLGVDLSSKIEKEKISDNKVLIVEDGFLISCFDEEISEETVESIAKKQPYYAVFSEGKMSDSTLANFEQIFDTYSPTTIRKVI